ncbi:MAG: MlaD family protein [Deltaproteobacteria bacterium]|jgi:phospholipid/cholesterol/gamma-HCH transport system substrate-binding protein|nr:MlaD family protein [Deltaproteobacteria bacterium]
MYKTSTEIKVGLFVLAALLVTGWMAVRLGGFKGYDTGYYQLEAVFDQVSGLKSGVTVEVAGISVGRVGEISLRDDRAHVTMYILNGVTLPSDTRALIKAQGILGDKYVELQPGTAGEGPLRSGETISNTASGEDLTALLQKLSSVADDLKILTSSLTSDGGGQELREIMDNVREMTANMNQLVKDNGPGLTEALASLDRVSKNLESITERVATGQGTLGQLIYDDSVANELRGSLASIRDVTQKISSGQGTLGRLVNDSGTADRIDQALDSVNEYLEKGDEIMIALDFRADYMTRYNFLKGGAGVRIYTSPDRYYLLGVTADYFGSYERIDFTGAGGTFTEEARNRSKLKINAQIAQRYYDFVVRGGIIESGAGIGVDYLLFDDDLTLTLEAFSGDFDHNPHLRAMVTWRFWKFLYVSAGYDDFISDLHRDSPFIGLGFWFTDDDLKLLLSGAGSFLTN